MHTPDPAPILAHLLQQGQSIWYDDLRRDTLSEMLPHYIQQGVRGITSNPTIIEQALASSDAYDSQIAQLLTEQHSLMDIYEALLLEDIGRAADLLRSVYDASQGRDGYVSLEVSPQLAHDSAGTVAEALRFANTLHRPNVMIKVPASQEGIVAIRELLAQGVNVNVTLLFSLANYQQVSEATMAGLETALEAGHDLSRIASVASFFVSRIDAKLHPLLAAQADAEALQGRIAIANAARAYAHFEQYTQSERWQRLAEAGAQPQRLLWASTSPKNASYPLSYYVDALVASHTVNTVPPSVLKALIEAEASQVPTKLLTQSIADDPIADLHAFDIHLDAITDALQEEGIRKFATSFDGLLEVLSQKMAQLA